MGKYQIELTKAMELLARDDKVIFIGQSVAVAGTAMRTTLENINSEKLIEMPVDEDFQMGVANGLAIAGYIPISIFPRWNFLLLATNQIVNHLDKLKEISRLDSPPKVIIRTGIGSINPLHPGPQHTGDFTDAFKLMCPNINVVRLDSYEQVVPEYQKALERNDGVSTLLVEWGDKYSDE
jgi:pyruvate/2-oxoglutarate/acetoin dehydrogenase E1 component